LETTGNILEIIKSLDNIPVSEAKATKIIAQALREAGYKVAPVSTKKGFYMVVVEDGERILLWIRSSPINKKSLEFAKIVVSKYVIDKCIILKTKPRADYVPVPWPVVYLRNLL